MPLAGFGGFLKYATGWMVKGSNMPPGRVGKGYANDRVGKGSKMPVAGWGRVLICHWMDGEGLKYATGWVGKGFSNDCIGKCSNIRLDGRGRVLICHWLGGDRF